MKNYNEETKVSLACLEFTDYANLWWEQVQNARQDRGEPQIATWQDDEATYEISLCAKSLHYETSSTSSPKSSRIQECWRILQRDWACYDESQCPRTARANNGDSYLDWTTQSRRLPSSNLTPIWLSLCTMPSRPSVKFKRTTSTPRPRLTLHPSQAQVLLQHQAQDFKAPSKPPLKQDNVKDRGKSSTSNYTPKQRETPSWLLQMWRKRTQEFQLCQWESYGDLTMEIVNQWVKKNSRPLP
jgi:hypothetical protein